MIGVAWPVAAGLALGGATFYLADRWVESRFASSGPGGAAGATLALGAFLDGIPEQAVLGIGLAQGRGSARLRAGGGPVAGVSQ